MPRASSREPFAIPTTCRESPLIWNPVGVGASISVTSPGSFGKKSGRADALPSTLALKTSLPPAVVA